MKNGAPKKRKSELDRLDDVIVAMRDREQFTVRDVANFTKQSEKTAHRYMKFMVKHGWAKVADGRTGGHEYRVCKHCGAGQPEDA